jgi:hypothetical protein
MDSEQFAELQKAREIGLKRGHYNLDVIPLLPRVRTKTPEQWLEFAQKYPLHKFPSFKSEHFYHDKKKNVYNPLSQVFKNPIKKVEDAPYKTRRLHVNPTFAIRPHAASLIKLPTGDYTVFDPHGIGSKDPNSAMIYKVPQLKKLIEDPSAKLGECETMRDMFQVSRGTCALWTELRRLHPEKSDEEFRQMVDETTRSSGLRDTYIQYLGHPKYSNLLTSDLIPLDIFEQMKERLEAEKPVRPTISAETSREEREKHRTGLGKYKKQLFSYPDTFV